MAGIRKNILDLSGLTLGKCKTVTEPYFIGTGFIYIYFLVPHHYIYIYTIYY